MCYAAGNNMTEISKGGSEIEFESLNEIQKTRVRLVESRQNYLEKSGTGNLQEVLS